MARSRQSLKRRRTDEVKARRNRSSLRALRTAMRRVREAESQEEREEAYRKAQSMLDAAGRRRLIHPNRAARLKSSLTRSPGGGE